VARSAGADKGSAGERQRDGDARRAMLAAIRQGLAARAHTPSVPGEAADARPVAATGAPEGGEAREAPGSLTEVFRQAIEAVSGRCTIVRNETEAATRVGQILEERGARRVAVSNAPLVRAVVERLETSAVLLHDADAASLFQCDVGLTSAQWAVAETGTLVLESDAERHRLASLVPPAHLALVPAGCIRRTLAEVLPAIGGPGANQPSSVVTFVTGPSRTSDIELTLAIGVHGPAQLDVIVLEHIEE